MSIDATRSTWKIGKKITAIQKLLLLSLADRAGETGECWPSLKRLAADTNLNIKTIKENRQELINLGFITYTGQFKGRTNQIPVMRLTYIDNREGKNNVDVDENFTNSKNLNKPKNGLGKNLNKPKNGLCTEPKNGLCTEPKNGLLNLKEESKTTTNGICSKNEQMPKNPVVVLSPPLTPNPQIPPSQPSAATTSEASPAIVPETPVNQDDIRCNNALLTAYRANPFLSEYILCEEDFLSAAIHSIENRDKATVTAQGRLKGIIKLIEMGKFKIPKNGRWIYVKNAIMKREINSKH